MDVHKTRPHRRRSCPLWLRAEDRVWELWDRANAGRFQGREGLRDGLPVGDARPAEMLSVRCKGSANNSAVAAVAALICFDLKRAKHLSRVGQRYTPRLFLSGA